MFIYIYIYYLVFYFSFFSGRTTPRFGKGMDGRSKSQFASHRGDGQDSPSFVRKEEVTYWELELKEGTS